MRFLVPLALAALCAAQSPIKLSVDASEAARRIFHARMTIPAKPGPMTLVYPKWIPGEHAPTGAIEDLAGLKITASGETLRWRRDDVDMYALHFTVPAGASVVEVRLDFLSPPDAPGFSGGGSATAQMTVVNWNQLLLYPQGTPSDRLRVQANLKVPAGWKYGTSLRIARESGDEVEFQPASLTTVIDAPVIAGRFFKTLELSPGGTPAHYLHIAADDAYAMQIPPDMLDGYKKLVRETGALFGARHYGRYDFLLSLSDHVAHFGLEHHESSDNRVPENALVDEDQRKMMVGLLPHEMVHSWNGKFRRPAGLATPDYQEPMKGELLWVYEGLTTYLGSILTPRSGLQTPEQFRESLALMAAQLDGRAGRNWRPLADTAVAAQVLYGSRADWKDYRRGTDFYPEGMLVWLEADTVIRRESQGARSLDDFCRSFYGGTSGPPEVKTYSLDDVVKDLNAVQAYDWKSFLTERLNRTGKGAPLAGLENGGWKLVYREELPGQLKAAESARHSVDMTYSLGLSLKDDGEISDVMVGGVADKAGMAPATRLVAVNGRQFTTRVLRAAVRESKDAAGPIELLVKNGEYYKTYRIEYHGGERYPWLERAPGKADVLSDIIKNKS